MKTTFKRAICLVLMLCLATAFCVSLAACDGTKDDGKLYVGLECAYSPFNYTQLDDSNGAVKISNADGYANGYDIMIAKRIAQALGKELVICKYEWDALVPAVVSGALDFVIAGMSPTAKRLEAIDFSDPYYQSNLVIVVRKDNAALSNATSLADFAGTTIVAQSGTFHDDALREQGATYGITRYTPMADFPAMINALNARVVDGYIAEEPGAIENCASNPDFTYVHLVNNQTGFAATDENTAIAVGMKKGSSIKDAVNEALAAITQSERNQMMEQAIALASGGNIVE